MEKVYWKQIKDYPNFEVSNLGVVRNIKTKKEMKPSTSSNSGYLHVRLDKKTVDIHVLVASTFYPNDNPALIVDHIDRDKLNNRADNLRYVTFGENNKNRDVKKRQGYFVVNQEGNVRFEETISEISTRHAITRQKISNVLAKDKQTFKIGEITIIPINKIINECELPI